MSEEVCGAGRDSPFTPLSLHTRDEMKVTAAVKVKRRRMRLHRCEGSEVSPL